MSLEGDLVIQLAHFKVNLTGWWDRRRQTPGRIAVILIWAASAALGQSPPGWRFWSARDGMAESYVRSMASDRSGNLWAVHGTGTNGVSVNDGYGVSVLTSPGHFARV